MTYDSRFSAFAIYSEAYLIDAHKIYFIVQSDTNLTSYNIKLASAIL